MRLVDAGLQWLISVQDLVWFIVFGHLFGIQEVQFQFDVHDGGEMHNSSSVGLLVRLLQFFVSVHVLVLWLFEQVDHAEQDQLTKHWLIWIPGISFTAEFVNPETRNRLLVILHFIVLFCPGQGNLISSVELQPMLILEW